MRGPDTWLIFDDCVDFGDAGDEPITFHFERNVIRGGGLVGQVILVSIALVAQWIELAVGSYGVKIGCGIAGLAVIFLTLGNNVAGGGINGKHTLAAVVMISGPVAPGKVALGGGEIDLGDPGFAHPAVIVAACFDCDLHFLSPFILWLDPLTHFWVKRSL